MTRPVTSYVIFGDSADVWPVVAMLATQLAPRVQITVIESLSSEGDSLVLPLDDPYFDALKVTARDLAEAGAGFALGYALDGFLDEGTRVIAAPSGELPAIAGLALHQVLRAVAEKAGALDRLAELHEGFRLCARAAAEGRMALAEDAPQSPLAMLGPLALIDKVRLAALLEGRIGDASLLSLEGDVAAIERGEGGEVRAVGLGDGRRIEADVFVDLRPRTRAVREGRDIGLPLLEAFAGSTASIAARPTADEMPSYAACSDASDGFSPHATAEAWTGNFIRLGPASASLGPLFCADARLLFAQSRQLAECLPARTGMAVEARRFNGHHARTIERLYELVAAPLHLNRRSEPAWKALREEIAPPPGLALRIEQFRSRGLVPECDGELVDRQFWIDLLMAFGVVPQRHDRRAESFAPRQLDSALGTVRRELDNALAAMPARARFMERFADG